MPGGSSGCKIGEFGRDSGVAEVESGGEMPDVVEMGSSRDAPDVEVGLRRYAPDVAEADIPYGTPTEGSLVPSFVSIPWCEGSGSDVCFDFSFFFGFAFPRSPAFKAELYSSSNSSAGIKKYLSNRQRVY